MSEKKTGLTPEQLSEFRAQGERLSTYRDRSTHPPLPPEDAGAAIVQLAAEVERLNSADHRAMQVAELAMRSPLPSSTVAHMLESARVVCEAAADGRSERAAMARRGLCPECSQQVACPRCRHAPHGGSDCPIHDSSIDLQAIHLESCPAGARAVSQAFEFSAGVARALLGSGKTVQRRAAPRIPVVVKDFVALYQAAQLSMQKPDGVAWLMLQLERLAPLFDDCVASRHLTDAELERLEAEARSPMMALIPMPAEPDGSHPGPRLVIPISEAQLERLEYLAREVKRCSVVEVAEAMISIGCKGLAELTPPERKALDALHRWLHSSTGDCELIEEAQDFHETISVDLCEELERAIRNDEGDVDESFEQVGRTARGTPVYRLRRVSSPLVTINEADPTPPDVVVPMAVEALPTQAELLQPAVPFEPQTFDLQPPHVELQVTDLDVGVDPGSRDGQLEGLEVSLGIALGPDEDPATVEHLLRTGDCRHAPGVWLVVERELVEGWQDPQNRRRIAWQWRLRPADDLARDCARVNLAKQGKSS